MLADTCAVEEKYGRTGQAGNGDGAAADDDSESSSDDETEDEDGYLLTEDLDARMSEALQAIKNKDPRVYNTDAKFFDAEEADKAGQAAAAASAKEPKEKPMFLRDYHRERYLKGDVGASDDEDDDDPSTKTYAQEQYEIKKALIDEMNAADDDEDDDDVDKDDADEDEDEDDADTFIKPKVSSKASKASASANGVHPSRAGRIQITKVDVDGADRNPELFLSNFMASRAWVPEAEDDDGTAPWQAFDSEDDENDDQGEAFEVAYNLRFEDPNKSNEILKSYSRTVVTERSVRRDAKTARQRQRDLEREQQAAEKQARREERARLRKLHIEEAQEKLAKIKQAAGTAGRNLAEEEWMQLLDDAWDNDAWEAKMKQQFDEQYYAEKDAEVEAELDEPEEEEEEKKGKGKKAKKPKKPKWDDDIDITDLVPDFADGAAPKITLSDAETEDGEDRERDGDEDDDDSDDDADGHEAKRRKTGKEHKKERADAKREARRERARIEALVDRQMALDHPAALAGPSSAGGKATASTASTASTAAVAGPFRYRETSPQSFGLTPRDILLAPSDSALNEFAGLKKLATFRDEERKRNDRKKLGKKSRLRKWRRETFGDDFEHTGPTFGFERLVGDDNEDFNAAPSSAKHHHSKKKSKDGKGTKDEPRDRADADGKKKRKRSGRKHKAVEASA